MVCIIAPCLPRAPCVCMSDIINVKLSQSQLLQAAHVQAVPFAVRGFCMLPGAAAVQWLLACFCGPVVLWPRVGCPCLETSV